MGAYRLDDNFCGRSGSGGSGLGTAPETAANRVSNTWPSWVSERCAPQQRTASRSLPEDAALLVATHRLWLYVLEAPADTLDHRYDRIHIGGWRCGLRCGVRGARSVSRCGGLGGDSRCLASTGAGYLLCGFGRRSFENV
jgi:hypothetical protein